MDAGSHTSPEFVRQVRNALAHLYDHAYLQNHPLAALVDPGSDLDRVTRGQRLRRLLLDCIAMLRPQDESDVASEAARAHSMLTYRYVDGVSMQEIAAMRALGPRQAYREVQRGVEAVASILQDKFRASQAHAPAAPVVAEKPEGDSLQAVQAEVTRLYDKERIEAVDPRSVLEAVLDLLHPMGAARGVSISVRSPEPWPLVRADRVMLRQGLLNLLTHCLDTARGEGLLIEAHATPSELCLTIAESPESSPSPEPPSPRNATNQLTLEAGQSLLIALGGRVLVGRDQERWRLQIILPTADQPTVLVIDDNRDLLALLQRYLAAHHLRVVSATDGEQALRLAEDIQPRLITLDVMMPYLDGWEILQKLKTIPTLAHTPIVICSVLPAQQLASMAGASDYLSKPVRQEDLLQVLRRWLGPLLPAD